MRINFPALFAFTVTLRHPPSASQAPPHRAPRFPTGLVAQRIREINNREYAAPREVSPRYIKHTGSIAHGLSVVASRIERRNPTQRQKAATQPMTADQGRAPPPCRSERHPLGLLKITSPALDVSSSKSVNPLALQETTHVFPDSDVGLSGAEANARLEELPLHSDPYFAYLLKRMTEALPYLPPKRAPVQEPTYLAPLSRSGSDHGYDSCPDSPGPIIDEQTPPAPPSPTFAELIRFGREALKPCSHPDKPALPATASADFLTQVRGFNRDNLKPVGTTVGQTVDPSVKPTNDKSPVTTEEAWAALNNAIPYMEEDTDTSDTESDIDLFRD